jgi:hypothetical protein
MLVRQRLIWSDIMSNRRFLELEARRKTGTLSENERGELRSLVATLGLRRVDGDTYCYCETSGFACDPDNPPPNCNCVCAPIGGLNA